MSDILECLCKSPDHMYIIKFDDGNKEYGWDKEVYIEPHLSTGNFWFRLKKGLKYIFGFKCRYGDFDEIVIDKTNYQPLKKIVEFFEHE